MWLLLYLHHPYHQWFYPSQGRPLRVPLRFAIYDVHAPQNLNQAFQNRKDHFHRILIGLTAQPARRTTFLRGHIANPINRSIQAGLISVYNRSAGSSGF